MFHSLVEDIRIKILIPFLASKDLFRLSEVCTSFKSYRYYTPSKETVNKFQEDVHFANVYQHYHGCKLIQFHYYHSYDGFDTYGPQSRIFDLIVYYFSDTSGEILKKDHWHREYWFRGKDLEQYALERTDVSKRYYLFQHCRRSVEPNCCKSVQLDLPQLPWPQQL